MRFAAQERYRSNDKIYIRLNEINKRINFSANHVTKHRLSELKLLEKNIHKKKKSNK